jgi:hypothetical protein
MAMIALRVGDFPIYFSCVRAYCNRNLPKKQSASAPSSLSARSNAMMTKPRTFTPQAMAGFAVGVRHELARRELARDASHPWLCVLCIVHPSLFYCFE